MAIGFPAGGSNYLEVTLPATNQWRADFWLWLNSTVDADIISFLGGSNNQWLGLRGGAIAGWSGGSYSESFGAIATNRWNHVELAQNADVLYLYVNGVYQGFLSGTVADKTILRLGSSEGESCGGDFAAVKLWGNGFPLWHVESSIYQPLARSGLLAWWPLLGGSLLDHSGNGRHLTAGGSATSKIGPPIAWSRPQRFVPFFIGSGATTHQASGSIPGAGALSGVAQRKAISSGSFGGTGALSGSAKRRLFATGSFSGVGVLAGAGKKKAISSGSIAGVSGYSLAANVKKIAAATVAGSSAISGTATRRTFASVSIAGTGALSLAAIARKFASSSFGGVATFIGASSGTIYISALIAGSSAVSGSAGRKAIVSSTIAGVSTVSGTAKRSAIASAIIAGSSAMSGIGKRRIYSAGVVAGSSSMAGAGMTKKFASAVITGSSTITLLVPSGATENIYIRVVAIADLGVASPAYAFSALADLQISPSSGIISLLTETIASPGFVIASASETPLPVRSIVVI